MINLQICDVKEAFVEGFGLDRTLFSDVASSSFDFQRFAVSSRSNYNTLQSEHYRDFAILDSRTGEALQGLSHLSSIRVEAVLVGKGIATQNRRGRIALETIPFQINIYGCSNDVEIVGKVLSKARIYLQHPHHPLSHAFYMNPHYLEIPHRPTKEPILPRSLSEADKLHSQVWDVTKIIDSIGQDQGLETENTSLKISTPLLE